MAREMRDGKVHAGPGADPRMPPAYLPSRAGQLGRKRTAPFPQEGRGLDRTPRGGNLHLDYDRSGAHGKPRWRDLIMAPQTARLQVVRPSVPSPAPIGGARAVVWTNRPALQLPQYRLTGKPDAEVYAEARARAAALAKRRR
jgi:hypothetical protein